MTPQLLYDIRTLCTGGQGVLVFPTRLHPLLSVLVQLGADVLPAGSAVRLGEVLLSELPGRLWDGKEGLLGALAALATHYTRE
jgi:hypothetical protein